MVLQVAGVCFCGDSNKVCSRGATVTGGCVLVVIEECAGIGGDGEGDGHSDGEVAT